jgi:hypothetical protein
MQQGSEMNQDSNNRERSKGRRLAFTRILAIMSLLFFSACTSNQAEKNRSDTFKQYESMVRWSQWDNAVEFIAPDYLEEHPVSRLDMDRLRLFRVTQYTPRSIELYDGGMAARQTVEIRMFNVNQAIERTVIDEQDWHYNPTRQRWELHSGLPDPTKR